VALRLHLEYEDQCIAEQMNSVSNPMVLAGAPPARKRSIVPITVLGVCVLTATAIFALLHPIHDFVEYWTAAHLLMSGKDPYSLGEVFRMEKALGFEQSIPIMLLSPPWTLPLLAPLGLAKSYALGWIFWIAVMVAFVAWSSRLLMDVYFGDIRISEISDTVFCRALFAFTFYPILLCLKYAQTAPLMLLGIAGFLYFERQKKDLLAGALLSLTLIKPQLFLIVWLALILWSFKVHRWKPLASALGCTVLLTVAAVALDRHVFQQYRLLTNSPYLQVYASGVAAGIRRQFGGVGTFWMQLVPPALGLGWFAGYWRKYSKTWSWTKNLPMLLTVSVATSAYGWLFDQTLLVLPVIALAARRAHKFGRLPGRSVWFYTALNFALMIVMPFPTLNLLPAPICFAVLLMCDSRAGEVAATNGQLQLCAE